MRSIFLLLLLSSGLVWGQRDQAYLDEQVQTFVDNLKERGIDQYLHTRRYCSGNIEMFVVDGKNCMSKGTYMESYIFWKEAEKAYVKKIDNCGLYLSVLLKDDAVFDFALSQKGIIVEEIVKPYSSDTYTGTPQQRKPVQPCFREFHFSLGNENFDKRFNLFDISNDSDGNNLNLEHNNALRLILLNKMIDAMLEREKRSFKRQIQ